MVTVPERSEVMTSSAEQMAVAVEIRGAGKRFITSRRGLPGRRRTTD
jgi:hypothetical protein